MAVTVTVGTNSYISVNDADTYFGNRLYSTDWTSATTDQKGQALIEATRKIDRQIIKGVKSISTQTLQFPRAMYADYYRDEIPVLNLYLNGNWYVETAVSQYVLDACCEEAIAILGMGNTSENYGQPCGRCTTLLSGYAREMLRYYTKGGARIG